VAKPKIANATPQDAPPKRETGTPPPNLPQEIRNWRKTWGRKMMTAKFMADNENIIALTAIQSRG